MKGRVKPYPLKFYINLYLKYQEKLFDRQVTSISKNENFDLKESLPESVSDLYHPGI